jgi:hypothetical protein
MTNQGDSLEYKEVLEQVQYTLSKHKKVRNLTTLISTDIFKKMIQGEANRKILTGIKYHEPNSKTGFDILLDMKDIEELADINSKEVPVIPYFNSSEIGKPQKYFLAFNEEFPDVEKFFTGLRSGYPRVFRLIKTSFNEINPKHRMFVPGSYALLEDKD